MRTVPAAALIAVLVAVSPSLGFATEAGEAPETTMGAPADGAPAAPAATDSQDESDANSPENQAGSRNDLMKNFTRHRPGACPEGPPCNVED
jgi:hypothetical protein